MNPHPLERVFAPRAVAVFAEGGEDSLGAGVLRNLAAGGFAGELHAVHPGRDELAGLRCRRSLAEVEGAVDLAVLDTSGPRLPGAIRDCAERGVAGAVILAGVSPSDLQGPGEGLGAALLEEARRHGLRLIGPDSAGLVRPVARLNALAGGGARRGALALVSESAAICTTVLDWAAAHRIGFSAVVSLGDALGVDTGEVLEYLALDAETRSILLYVERVRSARSFLTGLRIAARLKPVLVVRGGRHAAGASGGAPPPMADDAFDAALARTGAVRVPSVERMFAAARLLGLSRQAAGNRLAIVGNGRGPAVLAADRAEDIGVALAPLSGATRASLGGLLAPGGAVSNPVVLGGDAQPAPYRAALAACLADEGVDAVLALLAPRARARPLETAEAVVAASRETSKPILACWMGEGSVAEGRALLAEGGVPQFATPESAVEAFGDLASYRRAQRLLRQVPGPLSPDGIPQGELAREVVRRALAAGRETLNTAETRQLLAAFAVRLGGFTGGRVRGAALWASVERDPTFGPVIRFGPGDGAGPGRRDAIAALPPLNGAILRTLVEESPLAPALPRPGSGEHGAFERALWAISELSCEIPEVRGLEARLLATGRGEPVALEARVSVGAFAPGGDRYAHMAIHPYPSHLRARWRLPDGTAVAVRPIRPEDAEMEASFVRELSESSRYFRFMVPLRELTEELLVRFTQIDYDRELALLALLEREGQEIEIGVARYVIGPDGRSAHVAIVVADAWQGRGVGARLFGMLLDAARARGVERVEGEIVAENAPVRALLRRFGFTIRRDPECPATCLVWKDLAPAGGSYIARPPSTSTHRPLK